MSSGVLLLILALIAIVCGVEVDSELPNVVLVVTDDQDVVLKGMVSVK